MELIKCDGLITGYKDKQVVKNLTFCVNSGDFLCILGENGSGKTTLMRTLLGLNPPIGGSLQFCNGLKINELGYLPQQASIKKDFPASAYEVVLSGYVSKSHFFYSGACKRGALQAMEQLKVADLRNRCFNELSGGQQQRVLLARALCASSKMILLDEPVAGLDPDATRDMYEAIANLNRNGVTVIMISHDTDAALHYATHVLHLARKPLFFGSVGDYRTSDAYRLQQQGGMRV
jgi:zinc transport system ATP-binding protein